MLAYTIPQYFDIAVRELIYQREYLVKTKESLKLILDSNYEDNFWYHCSMISLSCDKESKKKSLMTIRLNIFGSYRIKFDIFPLYIKYTEFEADGGRFKVINKGNFDR